MPETWALLKIGTKTESNGYWPRKREIALHEERVLEITPREKKGKELLNDSILREKEKIGKSEKSER